jgi:hypothetical protein
VRHALLVAMTLSIVTSNVVQGQERDGWPILERSIRQFFAVWRAEWQASERLRSPADSTYAGMGSNPRGQYPRRAALDCDPRWPDMPEQLPYIRGDFVRSTGTVRHAECPSWFLGGRGYVDGASEADWLDAAIDPSRRATVVAARSVLIGELQRSVAATPSDSRVVAQLVRFLVDAQRWDEAAHIATTCGVTGWTCAALGGYVAARQGRANAAALQFATAWALMDDETRCSATRSWAHLFNSSERDRLLGASCKHRERELAWLWLLAAPLWTTKADDRAVEQWRRWMDLWFRDIVREDERWDWSDPLSDARRAVITRYGWPSFVWWGGELYDKHRSDQWGGERNERRPPFTTKEYFPPRWHLVPPLDDVANPFASTGVKRSHVSPLRGDSPHPTDPLWWPVEHSPAAAYGLELLAEGQSAFLRRDSTLLLATAMQIGGEATRRPIGTRLDSIRLFVAHVPDSVLLLDIQNALVGSNVVLRGELAPRPAVASVEYVGIGRSRPAGRARFGLMPPPPLRGMDLDGRAVSPPVLLSVPAAGIVTATPDSALMWMLGSTVVPTRGKLGLYWETYGFLPSDTVRHAVIVRRLTSQGIVRRLGIAMNVVTDRNTPVATVWTETRLGPDARLIGDHPTPVVGRSLILDLSRLGPGDYILEIAATSGHREPVSEQRRFTVR